MGFSLASFGAGFTGQLLKDRNDQKEEERLARRQALLIKLQEESEERTAGKKVRDGRLVKNGDQWQVEILDGWDRPTGKTRPASVAEVNAQESSSVDLEGKRARTDIDKKQSRDYDEDRSLDTESKRLQIAQTKQEMQLARNRDARAAVSERSIDTNSTAKKMEEIRELQLKAEAEIAELPDTPESKAIQTTYNADVNSGVAGKVGFVEIRRRLNRALATARGVNKRAATGKEKTTPVDDIAIP